MKWRSGLFQKGDYEDSNLRGMPFWPLSDGEVHYLYGFIQGSIMIPETHFAIHRGWGFCERHAWGAFAVELCFRKLPLLG